MTDREHDEGASSAPERPRPKILIVDDDPSNLGVFARAFRKNFEVRAADSALAALEELSREPVDILLTDYAMPGMNGIELLIAVAARWPTIPRVILSGHFDRAELHDAQRSGLAAALIEKPWTKAEILELVDRLLTKQAAPILAPT